MFSEGINNLAKTLSSFYWQKKNNEGDSKVPNLSRKSFGVKSNMGKSIFGLRLVHKILKPDTDKKLLEPFGILAQKPKCGN